MPNHCTSIYHATFNFHCNITLYVTQNFGLSCNCEAHLKRATPFLWCAIQITYLLLLLLYYVNFPNFKKLYNTKATFSFHRNITVYVNFSPIIHALLFIYHHQIYLSEPFSLDSELQMYLLLSPSQLFYPCTQTTCKGH